MNEKEIREALKKAMPDQDYPKEKLTATRAEFTTNVRMNQPKKDGCGKKAGMAVLLVILLIVLVVML